MEIRCFGIRIPDWQPWHTGLSIAGATVLGTVVVNGTIFLGGLAIEGTIHLGSEALNLVKRIIEVVASRDAVLFCAQPGSLELLVFTENEKSKQNMIGYFLSNDLNTGIQSCFGESPQTKVELTKLGAVIATENEFLKLKNIMKKKLKVVQQKIQNNRKATMMVSG